MHDTPPTLKPRWGRISQVAAYTCDSEWSVRDKIRQRRYRAKKSGRTVIIDLDSVDADIASLPEAHYAPLKTAAGAP
jgi:hypothetical protein